MPTTTSVADRRARFLGTTDDVTQCECCGRDELKSTVAISLDGESDPVFYGVVCAARALGTTAKVVRSETKAADEARAKAAREVADRKRAIEFAASEDWLFGVTRDAIGYRAADLDRFRRLERLGGYAAAMALYAPVRAGYEAAAEQRFAGKASWEITAAVSS